MPIEPTTENDDRVMLSVRIPRKVDKEIETRWVQYGGQKQHFVLELLMKGLDVDRQERGR